MRGRESDDPADLMAAPLAHQELGDPIARIAAFAELPDFVSRTGNEGQQRPIADQHHGRGHNLPTQTQVQEQERRDQVSQGQHLQHAVAEFKLLGVVRQQAAVDHHPQDDQDRHAEQEVAIDSRSAIAASQPLGHRERNGYADHEQEQRKDQVDEVKSFPGHVRELVGNPLPGFSAIGFNERTQQQIPADDPPHVKPAEGIERHEAGAHRIRSIVETTC